MFRPPIERKTMIMELGAEFRPLYERCDVTDARTVNASGGGQTATFTLAALDILSGVRAAVRRRPPLSVATRVMRRAVKAALVAITIIAPAREALSATITVHEPDGEGRVFVDVVGQINDDDFKTFTEKTDRIYPVGAGHPNKQVIVTLVSYGGKVNPALQIGDRIRKRGMSTFVPGDRTCASACALIW